MHDDVLASSNLHRHVSGIESSRGPYGILTLQVKPDCSALLRHDARLPIRRAATLAPDLIPISRVLGDETEEVL